MPTLPARQEASSAMPSSGGSRTGRTVAGDGRLPRAARGRRSPRQERAMDQTGDRPGREQREPGGEDASEGCTAAHCAAAKGNKNAQKPDQT
jgi:hypothetical protein